ncbi:MULTISPECIES: hypothetical protein [Lysinibacillus]|uniref:Uncharacterized protein n=1 Tax=Lysinibacillus xylanilyticus TaxID=582475 RepID=A0ABV3VXB6_9BACI
MGLYSTTRTVDVTTAQLAEMVRAQKKRSNCLLLDIYVIDKKCT